jgi:hypothetical protein
MIDNDNKHLPWHKEYYVWMIIFFPVLAIVAGIITINLAITSDDGLVVDDYYKEGLQINRTLERDQSAVDYQLQADIQIDRELQEVVLKLKANSSFVYPESLSVTFLNSTRAGLDKNVKMLLTEEGTYRGNLSALITGKWYVHIQRNDWRLIETINIK